MNDSRHAMTPSVWQCFLAALTFLTRIPVPTATDQPSEYHRTALDRGVIFFPIVGGLVGAQTALVLLAATSFGVPSLVAALLATGWEALSTGAFHEDAFADSCDALGGGWTRTQTLEIMRDSRLGTYGTVGLVTGVGLRVCAMGSMISVDVVWTMASIVAAAALGRLAIVGVMVTTRPVVDRVSRTNDISENQNWKTFLAAMVIVSPMCAGWFWMAPRAAMLATILSIVVIARFRRVILRRLGGTTGDLLGCSAYLVQLIVLITSSGVRGDV